MRALVIGRRGQLARALGRTLWPVGSTVTYLDREALDLARADVDACAAAIAHARASVVVNAAAYTAVDQAEDEPEAAYALNRDGPAALAAACARMGAALVHVSTDYVFDGRRDGAWREDDKVAPLGVYGASKAAGEAAVRARAGLHAILRTSWLYAPFGGNFVRTILRLAAERESLRVVADQRGCPTAAYDLARAVVAVAADLAAGRPGAAGTFHACGTGATTWHEFAAAILAHAARRGARVPKLAAIATADYPTRAARPANSALDCTKLAATFGLTLPAWQESLARCLDELMGAEAA